MEERGFFLCFIQGNENRSEGWERGLPDDRRKARHDFPSGKMKCRIMWKKQDGTIHESDNKKNRFFVLFVCFVVEETVVAPTQ